MKHVIGACLFMTLAGVALPAQQAEHQPVYRDLAAVLGMRVVCSNEHFGRIEDFVAEVPSGRITAAVVVMNFTDGARLVGVPFDEITYDAQSNLVELGDCRLEDHHHPAFDVTKVVLVRRVFDGAATDDLEGSMLVSKLVGRAVDLVDGKASAQGLTMELTSGHLAFVDLAVGIERAGDRQLHPVPWSAFACKADARSDDRASLALSLARAKAFVLEAPSLVEIIVRDPMRRARVYAYFGVACPEFDRGAY